MTDYNETVQQLPPEENVTFRGEYSEENKDAIIKAYAKTAAIIILAIVIPVTALLVGVIAYSKIWILLLTLIPIAILIIAAIRSPYNDKEKTIKLYATTCITVNLTNHTLYITMNNEKQLLYRDINLVKKVVDKGHSYYIYLTSVSVMPYICQKDLLVEGTLQQFERAFEEILEKE